MSKLPKSFREANKTKRSFRDQYAKLTKSQQKLVRDAAKLFHEQPEHPSFRRHVLEDRRGASHVTGSESISVCMGLRAIFVEDDGVNWWYWIGSHASYDTFTASR
ncbi:MAG: hypothetical protein H0T51_25195 [Pirellulales bacterium]|nr:hypothetical protein [Pirellulales bacterium]